MAGKRDNRRSVADTHAGLVFTTADSAVKYIKEHSALHGGDDEAVYND